LPKAAKKDTAVRHAVSTGGSRYKGRRYVEYKVSYLPKCGPT